MTTSDGKRQLYHLKRSQDHLLDRNEFIIYIQNIRGDKGWYDIKAKQNKPNIVQKRLPCHAYAFKNMHHLRQSNIYKGMCPEYDTKLHPMVSLENMKWPFIIFTLRFTRTGSGSTCYGSIYKSNHHHHHIVLAARISLTLFRHSSLSFIALGRSSGQQPVSSHSCWMYVRAGRPAFARPCVGIHKSTSLMSSSNSHRKITMTHTQTTISQIELFNYLLRVIIISYLKPYICMQIVCIR